MSLNRQSGSSMSPKFVVSAWPRVPTRSRALMNVSVAIAIGSWLFLALPSEATVTHRWSFSEASGTNILDTIGTANGKVVVIGTNTDFSRVSGMVRLAGGTRAQADYVEFPAGLVHSLTNVTIELWATPRAGQTWSRIFDFGPGNNTQAGTFFLSFCRGGTSLNQQRFEFGAPAAWTVDTGVATTAGTQYYYVVTWTATGGPNGGGLAQWYRDGVLQGSVDTGAMTIANVNDTVLWLGRSQYAADASATADYNELRIYNHAMSPAEINSSMANGPDNLVIPPPVAVNDAMTLNPGGMALIPVLQNDQGLQSGPNSITIVANPSAGTAQVKSGGKVLYTDNGAPGTSDQFTYRIQNAFGSNSGIATVFITISNSLRLPNTTITIPNSPPPTSYHVVDAFPGVTFTQPLALRTPAGAAFSNLLFVVEWRGLITYVDV